MTAKQEVRAQCTALRRDGERCRKAPIHGATVCKTHGGGAPQVRASAAVRAELAKWIPGSVTKDPGEELLILVTQSSERVELLSTELEKKVKEAKSIEEALVGDAMGEFGKVGEYIRGLAQLEGIERDRLARFSKLAIDANIGERQTRLAEKNGEMIARVIQHVMNLSILGLTEQQKQIMVAEMRSTIILAAKGELEA